MKVLETMRFKFCCVDYLVYVVGLLGGKKFNQHARTHIYLGDEFEEVKRAKLGALFTQSVGAVVLAGDPKQTIDDIKSRQSSQDSQLTSKWLSSCATANWHKLFESRRIADPLAKWIVPIFPLVGKYRTCRKPEERTYLLPVWFKSRLYDNGNGQEIGNEQGMFSHLLFSLSLELLAGMHDGCISIVVICLLTKVAKHVRAFLRWALPATMEELRVTLHLPEYHVHYQRFNFDALSASGELRVLGPVVVRGFTFKVAFWLGMKRRRDDKAWCGLITWWNLLYVHFTRASDRLYVLMEDLTDGVVLPAADCDLRRRGMKLGISGHNPSWSGPESLLRRQLHLASFKCLSEQIFAELDVCGSSSPVPNFTITKESLWQLPAIYNSVIVQQALGLQTKKMKALEQNVLHYCIRQHIRMTGWWPESHSGISDDNLSLIHI